MEWVCSWTVAPKIDFDCETTRFSITIIVGAYDKCLCRFTFWVHVWWWHDRKSVSSDPILWHSGCNTKHQREQQGKITNNMGNTSSRTAGLAAVFPFHGNHPNKAGSTPTTEWSTKLILHQQPGCSSLTPQHQQPGFIPCLVNWKELRDIWAVPIKPGCYWKWFNLGWLRLVHIPKSWPSCQVGTRWPNTSCGGSGCGWCLPNTTVEGEWIWLLIGDVWWLSSVSPGYPPPFISVSHHQGSGSSWRLHDTQSTLGRSHGSDGSPESPQ